MSITPLFGCRLTRHWAELCTRPVTRFQANSIKIVTILVFSGHDFSQPVHEFIGRMIFVFFKSGIVQLNEINRSSHESHSLKTVTGRTGTHFSERIYGLIF